MKYSYRIWRNGALFRAACDEVPGLMATELSHAEAWVKINRLIEDALTVQAVLL